MYRVNYGNGQVSNTFRTKREAREHILNCANYEQDPYAGRYYVQKYTGDGEWLRA